MADLSELRGLLETVSDNYDSFTEAVLLDIKCEDDVEAVADFCAHLIKSTPNITTSIILDKMAEYTKPWVKSGR